jgi:nucleotide-binding universal stress UspA family protein
MKAGVRISPRGVPAHAAEIGADLLVVGLHRPRSFLDALRETTMERLVRLSAMPVLLVRNPVDDDYDKVLALVSFSPACAAALRAAAELAPGVRPDAIHAVYVPFGGLTGEGPGSAMARAVIAEAEAAATAWRAQWGIAAEDVNLSLVPESVTQLMQRKLAGTDYDLLAIGAHTRSGPFSPAASASRSRSGRRTPRRWRRSAARRTAAPPRCRRPPAARQIGDGELRRVTISTQAQTIGVPRTPPRSARCRGCCG